jgi:hypothetical protein
MLALPQEGQVITVCTGFGVMEGMEYPILGRQETRTSTQNEIVFPNWSFKQNLDSP